MPVLAFAAEPPPQDEGHGQRKSSEGENLVENSPVKSDDVATSDEEVLKAPTYVTTSLCERIPIVRLDADYITDVMAARLATSLLGHVLFLKSQIPLPIVQLSRMHNSKSSPKATKLRSELLSSYDTIASHLNTTFTALSTSLAKSKGASVSSQLTPGVDPSRSLGQAYMAILVGPSLSSAKSRVIYAVDGLEARIWGTRDDVPVLDNTHQVDDTGAATNDDDEGADSDDLEDDVEDGEGPVDSEDEGSATSSGEDTDDISDSEDYSSEEASSPPPSRSPSPGPTSISYAEEQKQLQAADRLFSRTLALIDAEGDGMSADMTPTQTHIVLRAPRRFSHPAWIPRQNISASLENTLEEFLSETGLQNEGSESSPKRKKGPSVEGAWVTARDGVRTPISTKVGTPGDEWDEMVWWSWDGKIVGFSEW